ncbi:MAG: TonB-dependent receptor, partial [Betaproteobacteria bacterium]|nr:TonB-dependent receptor [Betaproteobacteria bacterium]
RNTVQNYGVSPNPNLKPETSTGLEMGLRLAQGALRGQIAAFDNRYQNFISSVRLACPGDPNCIAGLGTTFMSVNLSKVRIHGLEARLAWDFSPGWRVEGALARARGTDESAGQPLDTIEPTRLSLAFARDAGPWGAEARLRAASAVKRVNDFSGATFSPWFRPPGYGVFDLSAWWKPSRQTRVALALNNLFDKKYWLWSDIRLADARNPAGVDFYSQPGRNAAVRFEYVF